MQTLILDRKVLLGKNMVEALIGTQEAYCVPFCLSTKPPKVTLNLKLQIPSIR